MKIGELAEEAGVSRDTLSDLERGSTKSTEVTVSRVVSALEASEREAGNKAAPVAPVGQSAGMMEFEVTGDFGVRVIVRGPVTDHDILASDVARIMRSIRDEQQG